MPVKLESVKPAAAGIKEGRQMGAREKILYFDTFHEMIAAAKQYSKLGVPCTINSWEQIGQNMMHILDDDEWWNHWEADIE